MKKILWLLLLSGFGSILKAQNTINAYLVDTVLTNESFSDEWFYLTTDIYILNENQFTPLIMRYYNDSYKKDKKSKEKLGELEYLSIMATLKDLAPFQTNLKFPLYNFEVKQTGNNYSVSSETREAVRVIENYPLVDSRSNKIDCDIDGDIITTNTRSKIYTIIAAQLENLGNIANPTKMVMGLVGEFGKLSQSMLMEETGKKEYRFKSTIRLYEENFKTEKIHSVKVYAFRQTGESVTVKVDNLRKYLHGPHGPSVDKKILSEKIYSKESPLLVVVNYRSKYEPESVNADEITADYTKKYRERIEKQPMDDGTKLQERDYLAFMEAYIDLKKEVDLFNLNFKSGNWNEESKNNNAFTVLQKYRSLLVRFDDTERKNKDTPQYRQSYRKLYLTLVSNADRAMESPKILNDFMQASKTLVELNNKSMTAFSDDDKERLLQRLYNINLPKDKKASDEFALITKNIDDLEQYLYEQKFLKDINALNNNAVNAESEKIKVSLLERRKRTNCQLCKKNVDNVIALYDRRYEALAVDKMRAVVKDSIEKINTWRLQMLPRQECILNLISSRDSVIAASETLGEYRSFFMKIKANMDKLKSNLAKPYRELSRLEDLRQYLETDLLELRNTIVNDLNQLCELQRDWCNCERP